jgi:hypothetical protein
LDTPAEQKGASADKEYVGPLAHKRCEGRIDLADGVCFDDLELQSMVLIAASKSLNMVSVPSSFGPKIMMRFLWAGVIASRARLAARARSSRSSRLGTRRRSNRSHEQGARC